MTSSSRIAIFLPDLRGAGAERVAVRLANGIVGRGHDVDLVVGSADGDFAGMLDPAVTLVDLGAGRVLASMPALRRYLRRAQPDALLSHIFHANVVAVVARWLANTDTRLVLVEHNTYSVKREQAQGLVDRHLATPAMRAAYRFADLRVGVSEGVVSDLRGVLGPSVDPIVALPNPVITPEFLASSATDISADLPPLATGNYLLGMGRLTGQKRFDRLIRAYAQAAPDIDLVILGEGDLRPELEALIAQLDLTDRVHLPGFVDAAAAWLRQARGFVLSSDYEGLPTVLIEALAVGTPIVSTRCPSGPEEILDNGRYGLLVPVDDVDKLADGIRRLVAGGVPTAPEAADRYTVDRVVGAYLDVLLPA